jgi:hypothetical protein
MEPKPDAKDSSLISIRNWHHNVRHMQSAKTSFLCTTAIAKSNCEDNPVQRTMAIGAIADFQKVKSEHDASICEHCNYRYVNLGTSRRSDCHAWHNILFSLGAGALWRNSTS